MKIVNAGDKSGKTAHYEKTVDQNEKTITFIQKIYDKQGNLLEVHEKFPVDKRHIVLALLIFLMIGLVTYNIF